MSKLRLLKVVVQPVFALDDGDQLQELTADAVVVTPAEWPTFATTTFLKGVEQLEAQIAAQMNGDPVAAASGGQ